MRHDPLIVLKFGGSVLSGPHSLPAVTHEIHRWRRRGHRVVAVVSAFAGRTDALLAQCRAADSRPAAHVVAGSLAQGERESATQLALTLDRAGIPVRVLTPEALHFMAVGDALDADPISLSTAAIHRAFERDEVVVLPGFSACDSDGRCVTLGRGGSDLSALVLAQHLGAARCRLIKDVDGLYERDPRGVGPPPRRFAQVTWSDALRLDGSVLQHKACAYASRRGLPFELGCLDSRRPTRVGPQPSHFERGEPAAAPLRVGLLGLGTVEAGVAAHVAALPERFQLVGVAVRDAQRTRDELPAGVPLFDDPRALAEQPLDVLVEVIGGTRTAARCVAAALVRGVHVVTANKALLARRGAELTELANRQGARLLGSAAVGGCMPLLECLTEIGWPRVRSLDAVLNGTTNAILEELHSGASFEQAVATARSRGFSEADPSRDLQGLDAAEKLALLSAAAGGPRLLADAIPREALSESGLARRLEGSAPGARVRQLARLQRHGDGVQAKVELAVVSPDDPLADLPDEHNLARVNLTDGRQRLLRGRGAGRWPTAEALLGDLLELRRDASDVALPVAS